LRSKQEGPAKPKDHTQQAQIQEDKKPSTLKEKIKATHPTTSPIPTQPQPS
jgi:hypothetical protein